MDNNDKKRKGIGGFFDWVNADTDLPSLEELEQAAHHGHEDEGHGDEPAHADAHADLSASDAEEPTAEYAVFTEDEELEYPDQVVAEDEVAPEPAAVVEVDITEVVMGDVAIAEVEAKVEPAQAPAQPVDEKPVVQLSKRQRSRFNAASFMYTVLGGLLALVIIAVLLLTVNSLPAFGHADNPVINEVYETYIEDGMQDTGAVNIVAAMILDYRAFDTLGESLMLFTACMGVVMLIRQPKQPSLSRKAGEEGTA